MPENCGLVYCIAPTVSPDSIQISTARNTIRFLIYLLIMHTLSCSLSQLLQQHVGSSSFCMHQWGAMHTHCTCRHALPLKTYCCCTWCMLHVACCRLHVACCMLHVACCMARPDLPHPSSSNCCPLRSNACCYIMLSMQTQQWPTMVHHLMAASWAN